MSEMLLDLSQSILAWHLAFVKEQNEVFSVHLLGSQGLCVFSGVYLPFLGLNFCKMQLSRVTGVPGIM